MNIILTAITGSKDNLKEDQLPQKNAKYVAFVDGNNKSNIWDVRKAWNEFEDPNRNAKIHKIMPQKFLPDAEYSLWIDGSVSFRDDLDNMIEKYLKNHDIALFKHTQRDCIVDEALVCGSMNLDDTEIMSKQVAHYMVAEKYPRHNGLAECTVILRRHSPEIIKLNELWWHEICNGSRRDQLSFDYCCWKLGIKYNHMEGNMYQNSHFRYHSHNHYKKWGQK